MKHESKTQSAFFDVRSRAGIAVLASRTFHAFFFVVVVGLIACASWSYFSSVVAPALKQNAYEQQVRQAVKERPRDYEAWCELAYLLVSKGDLVNATEAYETVVRLRPAAIHKAVELGILLDRQERWTEAVAIYRNVLKSAPGNGAALLKLSWCLERTGR